MSKNKEVLIAIAEIIKETDEKHPITAQEICEEIENTYGIQVERRAVGRSIKLLIEKGMDIEYCQDNRRGCFMASHQFDQWELKILMDSVLNAKFLGEKASKNLVEKLMSTTSRAKRKTLEAMTPAISSAKNVNRLTQYNIQFIIEAIEDKKKIRFKYGNMDEKLQLKPRFDGKWYVVNPYALTWKEDVYYLICNYQGSDSLAYYRLDRVMDAQVMLEDVTSAKEVLGDGWQRDLEEFVSGTVGHYGGREKIIIELEVDLPMISYLYDEFGKGIVRIEKSCDKWRIFISTSHNQGLYHKLLQYGENLEILSPASVKDKYLEILNDIIEKHNRK
ncbi:MAG: WYL domain-containing transcriptional regulator [Eubacterium sp.]|nr:WYL domain-containing transcriptional regulator [Eubacterium sp.]